MEGVWEGGREGNSEIGRLESRIGIQGREINGDTYATRNSTT